MMDKPELTELDKKIIKAIEQDISDELKEAFQQWLDNKKDAEMTKVAKEKMLPLLQENKDNKILAEILENSDFLVKKSQWIFGGDGWAYDIGYGGLDHVLAQNDDVNVFVFDTEVYSNTGGQASKATPRAAAAAFTASGKKVKKKDLGLMAMSYGYVYVAQIAMGANMNQTVKAIAEAEAYDGPSLIIAYSPCIAHGIKSGMGSSIEQEKKAVDAGYWHLYRYNPLLKEEGKNPFSLDSKKPEASFKEFLLSETRYSKLQLNFPDIAEDLFGKAKQDAEERYQNYKDLADK